MAPWPPLDEEPRGEARRMLQQAAEGEVADYLQVHCDARDDQRCRLEARNNHAPERTIQPGLENVPVKRPRVDDR